MIKNSDYWYPWQPVKFRAATMHLTAEQDGIYRRLIDYYMETGKPLPESEIALCRIAHVFGQSWEDAKSTVLAFFELHDGKYFHSKCEEVLSEQRANSTKRVKKAKNAANSRWKNKKKTENAMSNAISNVDSNATNMLGDATGQDRIINKKDIIEKEKITLPDYIKQDLWDEFLQIRKKRNAVNSPRAIKSLLKTLETLKTKGHDANNLIENSIRNSWKDIYEPKPIFAAVISKETKKTGVTVL